MIKNFAALEVKIGEKIYKFLCDIDSPLGEVHDALVKMKSHIVNMINSAHQSENPSPDEQTDQQEE